MNYEVKVKFNKTQEEGNVKKVAEDYMVKNAELFGEVETFITKEMQPYVVDDFEVAAIKKSRYTDIDLSHNGDRYFGCKIVYITIDEKNGKEKNTSEMILICADNINEAKTYLDEHMKDTLIDYKVDTIKETKIFDVYDAK